MYHITNDKRAQVSSKSIIDSYIQLIKNGQYDQITITNLCEHAKVGRVTFYRHFDCLDDILRKLCDDKFYEQLEFLIKDKNIEQANFLSPYLLFWYDNIEIIEIILNLEKDYIIAESIKRIIIPSEKNQLIDNNPYLVEIQIAVFISVLKQWIKQDLIPEPVELSNTIIAQFKTLMNR